MEGPGGDRLSCGGHIAEAAEDAMQMQTAKGCIHDGVHRVCFMLLFDGSCCSCAGVTLCLASASKSIFMFGAMAILGGCGFTTVSSGFIVLWSSARTEETRTA